MTGSPGRFVAVEGIDGCGKSTQSALLAEALTRAGRRVTLTREPGGTLLGERVRQLVLNTHAPIAATAEMFLFAAARAQLVADVIAPALRAGTWVVSDRFLPSSLAYQGAARGLGIDAVRAANALAVGDCSPDLVVVLDVGVHEARSRDDAPTDRIETEGDALQEAVRRGYRDLAREDPASVVLVPASADVATVHERVWRLVGERLS